MVSSKGGSKWRGDGQDGGRWRGSDLNDGWSRGRFWGGNDRLCGLTVNHVLGDESRVFYKRNEQSCPYAYPEKCMGVRDVEKDSAASKRCFGGGCYKECTLYYDISVNDAEGK